MFDLISPKKSGFLVLDADGMTDKRQRGGHLSSGGRLLPEQNRGHEDYELDFMVEPGNTTFWKHDDKIQPAPRGAWGSWSFAIPYMTIGPLAHPMQLKGLKDPDFEIDLVYTQQSYGGVLPNDLWGIAASTTNHGPKDKIGVISGGPLVAHWRGTLPPQNSRHVFDIKGSSLDPKRHAGLHTVFEVRKWDFPCQAQGTTSSTFQDLYAIALNGKASADGTGNLFTTFPGEDAHLAFGLSGPLRPATKKHFLARTSDSPIHAGAIDTNAYFTGGRDPFDAPLDFQEEFYPIVQDGQTPYRVFLWYDPNETHPFSCGQKQGKWKWFVRLPVGETPPCTPTKAYATLDSNSNPARTFSEAPRLFVDKKIQASGLYLQPRPQLRKGTPANVLVRGQ